MKCDAKKYLRKACLVFDWMWRRRHDSYRDGRDNIIQKEMLHRLVQQRMTLNRDPQRPFSPPGLSPDSTWLMSCPLVKLNLYRREKTVNSGAFGEHVSSFYITEVPLSSSGSRPNQVTGIHFGNVGFCKHQICWNFTILKGQFSISLCEHAVIMVWWGSGTNTT